MNYMLDTCLCAGVTVKQGIWLETWGLIPLMCVELLGWEEFQFPVQLQPYHYDCQEYFVIGFKW